MISNHSRSPSPTIELKGPIQISHSGIGPEVPKATTGLFQALTYTKPSVMYQSHAFLAMLDLISPRNAYPFGDHSDWYTNLSIVIVYI